MKEAPGSSETSVLTRATRRNIPEDTFFHIFLSFIDPFRFTQPLDIEIASGLHDILYKIIETGGKQQ
jgi:hypothetical protein